MTLPTFSTTGDRAGTSPVRAAVIYLAFGLTWIGLTDQILYAAGLHEQTGFLAAASKGAAFVLLSAGLVYLLVRREVRAVTRSTALLNAVIEGTTDAIFAKDRDGKYLLCNEATGRFVGRPPNQVIGADDFALFDPDSASLEVEQDRWITDHGAVETEEETLTTGGETRTFLVTKSPLRDVAGRVVGLIGVARDITDRKAMEDELRHREDLLREAGELAQVGGWWFDPGTRRGGWTDETARIHDVPAGGEPTADFGLGFYRGESRSRIEAAVSDAVEHGTPYDLELELVTATGTVKWVRTISRPEVRDGKVVRVSGAIQDVTARKQAEEAVQQAAGVARGVLNSIDAHIAVIGTDGAILAVNDAWTKFGAENSPSGTVPRSGVRANYLTVCDASAAGGCEDAGRIAAGIRDVLAGRTGHFSMEYPCPAPDRPRWFLASVTPMKDGIAGAVVSHTNITAARTVAETVRTERDRLAALAATLPGVVYTFLRRPDGGTCFPYASPRAESVFGLNPTALEADARPVFDGMPPADAARVSASIDESGRTMAPWRQEFRFRHPTRGEVWIEGHSVPVPDAAGVLWHGYATDVTDRRRAETAARRWQEVFARIGLGMAVTDAETNTFLDVNPTFARERGYDPHELIGRSLFEIYQPEVRVAIDGVERDGHGVYESVHERKDGTTFPVLMDVTVLAGGDERPTHRVAAAFDLTSLRRAEDEVRAGEERYRLLFEANPQPMWVFDRGTLRFLAVNDAALAKYGYNRDEFLGMTIKDIRPPEDIPPLLNRLAAGRNEYDDAGVWRHRLKDGRVIRVRIVRHTLTFVGRPAEVVLAEDVTDRLRAEEALRESEARFRAFMDHNPLAKWVTDADARLEFANPRFALVYGRETTDVVGKTLVELVPPGFAERIAAATREVAVNGRVTERVEPFPRPDGTPGEAVVIRFPIPRAGGGVLVGGMALDVTDQRRAEDRLRVLGAAIDSSPNAVFITDRDGVIRWVNPAFTRLSGYPTEEAVGQTPRLLKSGRQESGFYRGLWDTILAGRPWVGEVVERRKDGTEYVVRQSITPLAGPDGAIAQFVTVQEDVTAGKQAEARLRELAVTDPLTGLLNRAGFRDRLTAAMTGGAFALHFLDLDKFKLVNDALGHQAGDDLLRQVADRVRHRIRGADTVGRLGGDEFAVAQVGAGTADDAAALARGLIDALAHPFAVAGQEVRVGASVGVTFYPADRGDPDTLLRNADLAMYRAKQDGRGTFRYYAAAMEAQVQSRVSLEGEIRAGIERGEFEAHFQPQVSIRDGAVVGAEALVRWRHPTRGLLPPGAFLPVAEDSGLILPLSELVLQSACDQGCRWRAAGTPVRVAVNVSVSQVERGDLVATVRDALGKSGLPPELLELEITEGMLLPDVPLAGTVLAELHGMGVKLAVDDFGTGYSSLSYLRRLPVDRLKIDRSFVTGVPEDGREVALVRAIIGLGHDLGLRVIAEGVETSAQLDFLRAEGCDEVQGYLYGKPVPADEFPMAVGYRM